MGCGISDEALNRSVGVVESFDMVTLKFVVHFKVLLGDRPATGITFDPNFQATPLNPTRRVRLTFNQIEGFAGPHLS